MSKNVVDDFGDDYFMGEYRNALYVHNGLLYRLKGFNVNGNFISGTNRYPAGEKLSRSTFKNIESLKYWLEHEKDRLARLIVSEPNRYYAIEDEDGDITDSEDETDEWLDWKDDVQNIKDMLKEGAELEQKWDDEINGNVQPDTVCIEFTPLSEPEAKPLLINVDDFVSLKGFSVPQGFINIGERVINTNLTRRCYKIADWQTDLVKGSKKYANQFIKPTYPTLQEAIDQLKANPGQENTAISKRMLLSRRGTSSKSKWIITGLDGDDIAMWIDGQKEVWVKNKNILGYINKKG